MQLKSLREATQQSNELFKPSDIPIDDYFPQPLRRVRIALDTRTTKKRRREQRKRQRLSRGNEQVFHRLKTLHHSQIAGG